MVNVPRLENEGSHVAADRQIGFGPNDGQTQMSPWKNPDLLNDREDRNGRDSDLGT